MQYLQPLSGCYMNLRDSTFMFYLMLHKSNILLWQEFSNHWARVEHALIYSMNHECICTFSVLCKVPEDYWIHRLSTDKHQLSCSFSPPRYFATGLFTCLSRARHEELMLSCCRLHAYDKIKRKDFAMVTCFNKSR